MLELKDPQLGSGVFYTTWYTNVVASRVSLGDIFLSDFAGRVFLVFEGIFMALAVCLPIEGIQ